MARRSSLTTLDELTAVTGYRREHAIRLPTHEPGVRRGRRPQRRVCGAEFAAAPTVVWEVADRIGSKPLKPLIPVLVPALEPHGRLEIDDGLRRQLSTVSAATMDRLLAKARAVARGGQRRRAGFSSTVRRSMPVRTFADWQEPRAGFGDVGSVLLGGAWRLVLRVRPRASSVRPTAERLAVTPSSVSRRRRPSMVRSGAAATSARTRFAWPASRLGSRPPMGAGVNVPRRPPSLPRRDDDADAPPRTVPPPTGTTRPSRRDASPAHTDRSNTLSAAIAGLLTQP
jgi:hypothetical protein